METQEGVEEARIKKVGVLSVANISGVINAIIGFIFGLIFVFLSSPPTLAIPFESFGLRSFGYLSIIIFPIIYGIVGFIGGAIGAFFYNIAAKITDGIKLYSE